MRKSKYTTGKVPRGDSTPSWYAGPGQLIRRQENPFRVAIRGKIRKGNK